MLGELKQRVIIKWDEEVDDLPENILALKWLPQVDILAHPNVKLFITHCGLGSYVESKFHGVPNLAIPVNGEQFKNAKNVVKEGWGIQLDFNDLSEKKLHDSIIELTENET